MWSSLPCFRTFCCSAIPTSCYVLNVFIACLCHFIAASAHAWAEVCHHTAAEVCHRQPLIYGQLTQTLATLAVLAEAGPKISTYSNSGRNNVRTSVNFRAFYQNDWMFCEMSSQFDHTKFLQDLAHTHWLELHVQLAEVIELSREDSSSTSFD